MFNFQLTTYISIKRYHCLLNDDVYFESAYSIYDLSYQIRRSWSLLNRYSIVMNNNSLLLKNTAGNIKSNHWHIKQQNVLFVGVIDKDYIMSCLLISFLECHEYDTMLPTSIRYVHEIQTMLHLCIL